MLLPTRFTLEDRRRGFLAKPTSLVKHAATENPRWGLSKMEILLISPDTVALDIRRTVRFRRNERSNPHALETYDIDYFGILIIPTKALPPRP